MRAQHWLKGPNQSSGFSSEAEAWHEMSISRIDLGQGPHESQKSAGPKLAAGWPGAGPGKRRAGPNKMPPNPPQKTPPNPPFPGRLAGLWGPRPGAGPPAHCPPPRGKKNRTNFKGKFCRENPKPFTQLPRARLPASRPGRGIKNN